jgi:CheY-like chemotaxis protein
MLNICVNARDAMADGGAIEIGVRASPGALAPVYEDAVAITIADAGTGMSPETLSHAFEPFFTTKEIGRGSGLGLAQVYGFIVQSKGRALLDSQPGKGTTVTLVFPRCDKPLTPAEEAPSAITIAAGARGERRSRLHGHVLLVEDDLNVATLTKQMLENAGLGVTHAKSARRALEVLESGAHADIVFSDVMMPGGMSGVDLAHVVRERWPALSVVLTTGYIEAARAATTLGLEVLVKPYPLQLLIETLGSCLARPVATGGQDQPRTGA